LLLTKGIPPSGIPFTEYGERDMKRLSNSICTLLLTLNDLKNYCDTVVFLNSLNSDSQNPLSTKVDTSKKTPLVIVLQTTINESVVSQLDTMKKNTAVYQTRLQRLISLTELNNFRRAIYSDAREIRNAIADELNDKVVKKWKIFKCRL